MRIRQIVPAFWADVIMQKKMGDGERLLYIGLWMLADDAGWFRADPEEVAAELLRFAPVEEREQSVRDGFVKLQDLKRIQVFDCGHGRIPALPRYQRISEAKKSMRIQAEHQERCHPENAAGEDVLPRDPPEEHVLPARNGTERERDETGRDGHGPNSLDELCALIESKSGRSVTNCQRSLIFDMADRRGVGPAGFLRLAEILNASPSSDPISVLVDDDRLIRERGQRSAFEQEAASARMRASSDRGRSSPTRIGDLLVTPADRS